MSRPTIDHRGPEFARLAREVLNGVASLAGTVRPVALYPSSGTGAWEAALVNTLSPDDKVLAFETGHFAVLWAAMARRLGLDPAEFRRRNLVQPEDMPYANASGAAISNAIIPTYPGWRTIP